MVSKENKKNKVSGSSRPIQIGFSAESREIEQGLDLNQLLISKPAATFFFRLSENVYGDLGFKLNDILVVDRSISPYRGAVVIFTSGDGFLLGRCEERHYEILKRSRHLEERMCNGDGILIWGVVTGLVRDMKGGSVWNDSTA